MAYKSYVAKNTVGIGSFLADLWQWFSETGWELWDEHDVDNYRVYRTNGENSQEPYAYVIVSHSGSQIAGTKGKNGDPNRIYFCACAYWEKSEVKPYRYDKQAEDSTYFDRVTNIYLTSEAGWYYWLYGNGSWLTVISLVGSTYYTAHMGMCDNKFMEDTTTFTASANKGVDVNVAVADGSKFIEGEYYQIIPANGAGTYNIKITAISGNTITLEALPIDIEAGDFIGKTPSTFVTIRGSNSEGCWVNGFETQALINAKNDDYDDANFGELINNGSLDPEYFSNKQTIRPLTVRVDSGNDKGMLLGYLTNNIFRPPSGVSDEELVTTEPLEDATATIFSNNTIGSSSLSMTTNEYTDYYVLIYAGTGYGQTRKISGNTADTLTVYKDWNTQPDGTSYFKVVKEMFRCWVYSYDFAIREDVN